MTKIEDMWYTGGRVKSQTESNLERSVNSLDDSIIARRVILDSVSRGVTRRRTGFYLLDYFYLNAQKT